MSAPVEAAAGEVVQVLSEDDARKLTADIKVSLNETWRLLEQAHAGRAWLPLGFGTFEEYVKTEFDMSRSRAYQLLDQATVIHALTESAGVSTTVDITEREARDIKPRLKSVTERVTAETKQVTEEPERARVVENVLAEERAKAEEAKRKKDADNAAIRDLNEKYQPEGFDPAENERLVTERGAFSRLCRDLSKLPPPEDFLARQRNDLTERHIGYVEGAYEWLDAFILMWRDQ